MSAISSRATMIGLLQSGRGAGSGRLAPIVSRGLLGGSALTLAVRCCGLATAPARGVERVWPRVPADLADWRVGAARGDEAGAPPGAGRSPRPLAPGGGRP